MTNARYTEEQVRRWLSFLASRRREHDQSMLLVEQLQPSWLTQEPLRSLFVIISFLVPVAGHYMLLAATWLAMGAPWPSYGVGEFGRDLVKSGVQGAIVILGLGGLTLFGLFGGFAVMLAVNRESRATNERIRPAERLGWSFRQFCKSFSAASWGCNPGVWLVMLPVVFFQAVFASIHTTRIALTTRPNQGIWLSLRHAGIFLLPPTALLIWGLVTLGPISLGFTLLVLLVFCYVAGWYGGMDVLDHFLLRWLLYSNGDVPWDYVAFLDYAANELGFLQKVGGGYIFMHRSLLEYFAGQEMTKVEHASSSGLVSPGGRGADQERIRRLGL